MQGSDFFGGFLADETNPGQDNDQTLAWPSGQAPRHPDRIGPYHLLNILGEGGMGIVYLAEQREPLRRRVAIKLIKHGLDSRRVLARFESERQALALMNHPGVAKVYDAGIAEDGRPYFVMEYVPGLPITDFCDRRQLDIQTRLKLFVQVCDAIHHAHQKGLIHRDIKPSNVLVTEQEGNPTVKVIDFGVAKATNQPLTERTLFTERGVLIGTPGYMSPEQAGTTSLDVDSRSDIYSLGVLLYELLVGTLPLDPRTLREAAAAEMLRMIREEELQKPTTRIESLGEAAESVARRRQTDVRTLIRFLRGDLDWITMRALEKNPARRYASASEFGSDVQRHLAAEPVLAGPPGVAYLIQKFVRKHRAATAGVIAVFATLAIGVALSTALYLRAENERERVQFEADALQAALRDQPDRYLELAQKAIERHRKALGSSLEFARILTNHSAISALLPIPAEERQVWEREATQIISRELDRSEVSAVDAYLLLADVEPDNPAVQKLSATAFDLLRKQGKNISQPDKQRLADLLESEQPADSLDGERVAREIVQLRREALPGESHKLQISIESLADLLARKAFFLQRQGQPTAACPVFMEVQALLREPGVDTGAYSKARILEIDNEVTRCRAPREEEESLLAESYRQFEKEEGIQGALTQIALSRLIDFYHGIGMPEKAARYRALKPAISLVDAWDLGPITLHSHHLRANRSISVPLNGRSAWLAWDSSTTAWGTLDESSVNGGRPLIHESDASLSHATFLMLTDDEVKFNAGHSGANCISDCGAQWSLSLKSGVADPARNRALLFYAKSLRGRSESVRGVSLAIWHDVAGSTERPEVRPKANEPTLLFGSDEPAWGTAALAIDGLLYAYACDAGSDNFTMKCLLARVPLEQALEPGSWRYYASNGRWSENWHQAKPVLEIGKTDMFSVEWNKYLGKYLAFSTRPLDYRIQMRTADRLEGPWSESVVEVEGLCPSIGLPFPWIGVSVGHPELATQDGQVEFLTYSRSTGSRDEIRMLRIEFNKKD